MSKLNTKKLVIIGAGGFAREVAWLVSDINKANTPQWELVGFWDNEVGNIGKTLNGIPIIGDEAVNKHLSDLFAVVAIGNPGIKKRAVQQATQRWMYGSPH